ncbi:MAG: hypothetical protein ABIB71_06455 [Candidatus Woesearchaeota archaeon]
MEKTINDGKDKAAYQLKKLLGNKEKQDLGDKSRWEKIPVNYIITANTLGVELNDCALKRLNESEDKDQAFYSVLLTQYFAKEARKLKKDDLAEQLEQMVEDDAIKTDELAMYAVRAIDNTLPKDKRLEKLAKVHSSKKIKNVLKKKEVTLDIVLVPLDKENMYVHTYLSDFPDTCDGLVVNIYSKDKEGNKLEEGKTAFKNNLEERMDVWKSNLKDPKMAAWVIGLIAGSAVVGGAIAGLVTGDPKLFYIIGGVCGGGYGVCATIPALVAYSYSKKLKKANKSIESMEELFSKAEINWIKYDALENPYNSAMNGKEMKECRIEDKAVADALEQVCKKAKESKMWTSITKSYNKLLQKYKEDEALKGVAKGMNIKWPDPRE